MRKSIGEASPTADREGAVKIPEAPPLLGRHWGSRRNPRNFFAHWKKSFITVRKLVTAHG